MRTFRCVYINCYNSIRFFVDISKKLEKGYNFWKFKDHNSGRRCENKTNNPIIFICFSSTNCLGTSFLHLKIVKIHFHGTPFWSILVCKISEFWRLGFKAVRLGFFRIRFRKHTHRGKRKTRFYFLTIESRISSKIFRVILWSKVVE